MPSPLDFDCWTCHARPGERCRTRSTDTHAFRVEMAHPRPGSHACKTPTLGCFRCELSRDELETS